MFRRQHREASDMSSSKMKGVDSEFGEEILEMIVARMPFPYLFKAQVLSIGWYLKFPKVVPFGPQLPSSSESLSFQSEVFRNCANWATYSPVYFNPVKMSLLMFDRIKSQWLAPVKVPSYLPTAEPKRWCSLHCAGALVLFQLRALDWNVNDPEDPYELPEEPYELPEEPYELFVSNVLTRSHRKLVLPPLLGLRNADLDTFGPDFLCLIATGCRAYKVVAMFFVEGVETTGVCVHTYHSNLDTWTSNLTEYILQRDLLGLEKIYENYAYFDGKLYFLASFGRYRDNDIRFCTYDIENNEWTVLVERINDADVEESQYGVFHCGDKVIVVVAPFHGAFVDIKKTTQVQGGSVLEKFEEYSFLCTRTGKFKIFQFDLESLELVLISDGPPQVMVVLGKFEVGSGRGHTTADWTFSSDSNSVYFSRQTFQNLTVRFDLSSREWIWMPLASCPPASKKNKAGDALMVNGLFEPGLNPFAVA